VTRASIALTPHELQSGLDRQRHAELLILQLPADHDGRNTWLLNYGVGREAAMLRACRRVGFGVQWNEDTRAAQTVSS
jgi:hypothetical protein